MLEKEQKAAVLHLEENIEDGIKRCAKHEEFSTAASIEQLESEKERVLKMGARVFAPRDKARVAACIALIPISWESSSWLENMKKMVMKNHSLFKLALCFLINHM